MKKNKALRTAVIDVGTNSILYLLAERRGGTVLDLFQRIRTARLGESISRSGRIGEQPLERAIRVLDEYRGLARIDRADRILAVGTHVFRTAANREDALHRIQERTGLSVEVLSETEEALWAHRGAVHGRFLEGPVLTADIGGGSTELVLGRNGRILQSESMGIGAVTLAEQYLHHDPPVPGEMADLKAAIRKALEARLLPVATLARQLVAVGGTATTLAALDLGLVQYDPKPVDGHILPAASVENLLLELARLDADKRRRRLALDPARADIIVAGTAILDAVTASRPFDRVLVSDRGLRFGIALRECLREREMP